MSFVFIENIEVCKGVSKSVYYIFKPRNLNNIRYRITHLYDGIGFFWFGKITKSRLDNFLVWGNSETVINSFSIIDDFGFFDGKQIYWLVSIQFDKPEDLEEYK